MNAPVGARVLPFCATVKPRNLTEQPLPAPVRFYHPDGSLAFVQYGWVTYPDGRHYCAYGVRNFDHVAPEQLEAWHRAG